MDRYNLLGKIDYLRKTNNKYNKLQTLKKFLKWKIRVNHLIKIITYIISGDK